MILADDNFSTIVVAIKEGRRIYTNIQNVIVYLLASNLAEVLIIFFATLMNKTILLPIQILWINLVTDTIPAIALGFEKEQKNIMKQKPRKSNEKFFNGFLTSRIMIPAILKSIIIFAMYIAVERSYHDEAMANGTVFITLTAIELLFAFICRSDREPIYKIGFFSNMYMVICVVSTFIIQYFMLSLKVTREWLKVKPMPVNLYIGIIAISFLSIIMFEIVKLILAKIYLKEEK
jgi:Ca2+-transporting ATPase